MKWCLSVICTHWTQRTVLYWFRAGHSTSQREINRGASRTLTEIDIGDLRRLTSIDGQGTNSGIHSYGGALTEAT